MTTTARARLARRARGQPVAPPPPREEPAERVPCPSEDPRGLPDDLIEATAVVLSWRGFVEFDDGLSEEEVLAEIRQVASAYPTVTLPDMLADYWIMERQEAWERSLPTWTCECGSTFKVLPGPGLKRDDHFYRVIDDGLVGDCVGSTRGVGHPGQAGQPRPTDTCPDCGRTFADTIKRQSDPQGYLFM